MIPKAELPRIADAIFTLVRQHGHPDDIPINSLAEKGIPPAVADGCFALLTSEDFPSDARAATAKWLRLIGEYSA